MSVVTNVAVPTFNFMVNEHQKPRVFISSVVNNFKHYREAAGAAVEEASGVPLLVNEDFPALDESARNACLDAVASSDAFILIVGPSGGSVAPSGKLVIEEEYEEARRQKIPIFIFLEDTDRDEAAASLSKAVSDYVDGRFRKTFSSPEELHSAIVNALSKKLQIMKIPMTDTNQLQAMVQDFGDRSDETRLNVVIAPVREDEVIDPVTMEDTSFRDSLIDLVHSRLVKLFPYNRTTDISFENGHIIVYQRNDHRSGNFITLSVSEMGTLQVIANVIEQDRNPMNLKSAFEIDEQLIDNVLQSIFSFAGEFFRQQDPHRKYHDFYYTVALAGIGYRRMGRSSEQKQSYPINMGGNDMVVAFDQPRRIDHNDFDNPAKEIQRVLALLRRQVNQETACLGG